LPDLIELEFGCEADNSLGNILGLVVVFVKVFEIDSSHLVSFVFVLCINIFFFDQGISERIEGFSHWRLSL